MVAEASAELTVLKNYIGGKWVASTANESHEIRNPATDEVLAHVPLSGEAEIDAAVRAAAEAFVDWRRTPPQERARYFFKLRQLLDENRDELARLIVTEMGKNAR
jgi:malonate-semialdehyde dehydrogenase (acetylating)/methylmalonate-semialdehyde dehydrogenase